MPRKAKCCLIWLVSFEPDPRTRHQRVCSGEPCQRERKRRKWRRWAAGHRRQRQIKARLWARSRPAYWRDYRKSHPDYAARDNKRRCLAAKRARRSAKQTLMLAHRAERIASIRRLAQQAARSAKQTPIFRLGMELADYLCWRDSSAKQTHMVLTGPPGG